MSYEHDPLGFEHRVLAWLGPHEDRIGSRVFRRDTVEGLAAHLTDDPHTNGSAVVTAEEVRGALDQLIAAKLLKPGKKNGTFQRTAAGEKTIRAGTE